MTDIHISEDKITSPTGVWFYASKLLEDNNLINSGKNQYKLLVWLEKENKGKIKDHCILKETTIRRPKDKRDIMLICLFEIKMNNENQAKIQQEYSLNYPDKIIFEHPHLPGKDKNDSSKKAEDIESGNLTKEEIISSDTLFKSDLEGTIDSNKIANFKTDMKSLMKLCSMGEWETAAISLYSHFCGGTGEDYSDSYLTKLVKEHENTKIFIRNCRERFITFLDRCCYDIMEFDNEKYQESFYGKHGFSSISRPIFDNTFRGSKICLHDIQGFTITVKNFIISNKGFSCSLCFDLYDHFGLDLNDIKDFGNVVYVGQKFRAWYILQHLKNPETGCKAFVDHMEFSDLIEGRL